MTRAPRLRAIWPANEPSLPAATETKSALPSAGFPTSVMPKLAVRLLTPKMVSMALGSTRSGHPVCLSQGRLQASFLLTMRHFGSRLVAECHA